MIAARKSPRFDMRPDRFLQSAAAFIIAGGSLYVFVEVRRYAREIALHHLTQEIELWRRPSLFSATAVVLLAITVGGFLPLTARRGDRAAAVLAMVYFVLAIAFLWTIHRLAAEVDGGDSEVSSPLPLHSLARADDEVNRAADETERVAELILEISLV
jgi:hypothetical protein